MVPELIARLRWHFILVCPMILLTVVMSLGMYWRDTKQEADAEYPNATIRRYSEVLYSKPEDRVARLSLVMECLRLGDSGEAIRHLRNGTALSPESVEMRLLLTALYLEAGQERQARPQRDEAVWALVDGKQF